MSDTPTPDENAPLGFPAGTVLESREGDQIIRERIVDSVDSAGNVIGQHKEPIN